MVRERGKGRERKMGRSKVGRVACVEREGGSAEEWNEKDKGLRKGMVKDCMLVFLIIDFIGTMDFFNLSLFHSAIATITLFKLISLHISPYFFPHSKGSGSRKKTKQKIENKKTANHCSYRDMEKSGQKRGNIHPSILLRHLSRAITD